MNVSVSCPSLVAAANNAPPPMLTGVSVLTPTLAQCEFDPCEDDSNALRFKSRQPAKRWPHRGSGPRCCSHDNIPVIIVSSVPQLNENPEMAGESEAGDTSCLIKSMEVSGRP